MLFKGRNFYAPLKDPKKIMDIGTGTGKWAIEMGMRPAPFSGAEANNAKETNSPIAKYAAAICLVISADRDLGNRNRFVTNPA